MSGTQYNSEPFAFTAGRYGDRPVFILTRRWKQEGPEVTLYELAPNNIAQTRRERFDDMSSSASLTIHELPDIIADGQTPNDIKSGHDDGMHDWSNWQALKIVTLSGERNKIAISSLVRPVLTSGEYDTDAVCVGSDGSLAVSESVGIRLSIGFRALQPVRKQNRLQAIADGVNNMTLGECYYWHAKMRSPTVPSGAKALRTLLSSHIS